MRSTRETGFLCQRQTRIHLLNGSRAGLGEIMNTWCSQIVQVIHVPHIRRTIIRWTHKADGMLACTLHHWHQVSNMTFLRRLHLFLVSAERKSSQNFDESNHDVPNNGRPAHVPTLSFPWNVESDKYLHPQPKQVLAAPQACRHC